MSQSALEAHLIGTSLLKDVELTNFIALYADNERSLKDYLAGRYPFPVEMPCGAFFTLKFEAEVPKHSMPCSCGVPGHWFVKYG